MPDLDVSDILLDPDFCEQISVIRNVQIVDAHGRAQQTPTTIQIYAVVTQGSMLPMERAQELTLAREVITVHSQTRLLASATGRQADIVVWKGSNFVVKKQSDWSQYGNGFTAAECELQDTVGQA